MKQIFFTKKIFTFTFYLISVAILGLSLYGTSCQRPGYSETNDDLVAGILDRAESLMLRTPDSVRIILEQLLANDTLQYSISQAVDIYNKLGTAYSIQFRLEQSDSVLKRGISLLDMQEDSFKRASILINLGINQDKRRKAREAVNYYLTAASFVPSQGAERLMSQVDNNLGISYTAIGLRDSAVYHYQKVLDFAKSNNNKRDEADVLTNMATTLYRYKEAGQAEENLKRAISLYQETDHKVGELNAFSNLAIVQNGIGKVEEAEKSYIRVEELANAMGNLSVLSSIYNNRAKTYYDAGRYDETIKLLKKSLDVKSKLNDTIGMVHSWNSMSAAYTKMGKYDLAERYSRKVLDALEGKEDITLQLLGYENWLQILISTRRSDEAFDVLKKRDQLQDSVFTKEKFAVTQQLQTQYETKEKEQQIAYLEEKRQADLKLRILLTGIAILLAAALMAVYLYLKTKAKASRIALELTKLRQEEVELQLRLKEEQVVRYELEKYESMLEINFMESEIGEKNQELELLKKEQEELNERIVQYSRKLKAFEQENDEKKKKFSSPSLDLAIQEIEILLEKKNICERSEYHERMGTVSPTFFENILDFSPISYNYLKYCICFAIDMEINDICSIFSVESATVHMIRYRIKQKLSFNKEENITVFLRKIANDKEIR